MTRPTSLNIHLPSLVHNLNRVRTLAPNSHIMAMIKANAYGHGLIEVGQALKTADAFGVAFLEEALELREAQLKTRIVLLEGFFNVSELDAAIHNDCDIVIHHTEQLDILERHRLAKPLNVWLKIDTGMHRLGFDPSLVHTVWKRLSLIPQVKIFLLSHFIEPDNLSKQTTRRQFELFNHVIEGLSAPRSLANSAGIIAWPETQYEWVRPGITLYGVSPFADKTGLDYDLQPVMTLRSELIAIKSLKKGDTVGYGATWVSPDERKIGTVAIGYGDGYPRHAKNGTPVLVNNKIAPLIGRVSMDMIMVDLQDQPEAKVGDPVVLWGEGLPVEKVAQCSDTIAYELLCKVTSRVKRNYF